MRGKFMKRFKFDNAIKAVESLKRRLSKYNLSSVDISYRKPLAKSFTSLVANEAGVYLRFL